MVESRSIDGDLVVGRHLTHGGDLKTGGDGIVKGDLRVEGWFDAPNVKHPVKGLFASEEKLKGAYARPREGWVALVGETLPADVYIVENGEWKATGQKGGELNVDLDAATNSIKSLQAEMARVSGYVDSLGIAPIDFIFETITEMMGHRVQGAIAFCREDGLFYTYNPISSWGIYTAYLKEGQLRAREDLIYRLGNTFYKAIENRPLNKSELRELGVTAEDIRELVENLLKENGNTIDVLEQITVDPAERAAKIEGAEEDMGRYVVTKSHNPEGYAQLKELATRKRVAETVYVKLKSEEIGLDAEYPLRLAQYMNMQGRYITMRYTGSIGLMTGGEMKIDAGIECNFTESEELGEIVIACEVN